MCKCVCILKPGEKKNIQYTVFSFLSITAPFDGEPCFCTNVRTDLEFLQMQLSSSYPLKALQCFGVRGSTLIIRMLRGLWMEGKVCCLGVRIWHSCYEMGHLTMESGNAAISLALSLRHQYIECHVICLEIWKECMSCGENLFLTAVGMPVSGFTAETFNCFFFSWLLQFLAA